LQFSKKLRFALKNKKMVKNPQNLSKKLFLSLKYLILLTFKVKNRRKKSVMFFLDFSHGITHLRLKVAEIRWGDVTVVAILLLDGPKGLDHSGSLVPG
jgi:hypothetical protein